MGNANEIIAAENILAIIKSHINNENKNTQDEKTGSLASIIEEIESDAIAELQLLDAKDWFDALKNAHKDSINYETKLLAFKFDKTNDLSQIKNNYFDSLLTFINYIPYLQKITKCKKLELFYTRVNALILELTSKIKEKNRAYKIKKLANVSSKKAMIVPEHAITDKENVSKRSIVPVALGSNIIDPIPLNLLAIPKAFIKAAPNINSYKNITFNDP